MTGTKVEAIHHHGVALGRGLRRRARAERRAAPRRRPAAGLQGRPRRGRRRPATIVCGAPNVAGGQTVAVARPGAVMPDGTKLKQAKLRGVVSEGMILAETELEIGSERRRASSCSTSSSLDAELAPGTPLADVLPIAIDVLELEITPNRPDCLGVYGVARELHAATGAPLARGAVGRRTRARPAPLAGRAACASSAPTCARASPRACSRTSRSRRRRRG